MTKYKTKSIDYTGCNPTIAAYLQRGEAVWCRVWDFNYEHAPNCNVVGFMSDSHGRKYMTENGSSWNHAEPIPQPERRLKKASEIIAECERRGWTLRLNMPSDSFGWYDGSHFNWIFCEYFQDCGKTESRFNWPDWAWEEV